MPDDPPTAQPDAPAPPPAPSGPGLVRRLAAKLWRDSAPVRERLTILWQNLPLPESPQERRRYGALVLAILGTLALPFILRPSDRPLFSGRPDATLVVITPHSDTIRREFGEAFQRWYTAKTKKSVRIDWRSPGGTSEIAKIISSDYAAAFENAWKKDSHTADWQEAFAKAYSNPKNDPPKPAEGQKPAALTPEQEARRWFMQSNIGIGVDLFFGGGVYDFEKQRKAGTLVATDASGKYGLKALASEHPKLFGDIIPQSVDGEPYFDPGLTWAGNCLSTFGIVYNRDVLQKLGIPEAPKQWKDLTDPRYYGQVAVVDPTKSGSMVKAFEMVIQQQMRESLEKSRDRIADMPPKLQAEGEQRALRQGWIEGLRLIQRIAANARYFTDYSPKVPSDVAHGLAAAGMCIDFYGRTFDERVKRPDGSSRVGFVTPVGGTSTGVDSIAMFRGAPHPDVAHAFLEFMFSVEGQSLWDNRIGTPNGPRIANLRRLPVRKDMYTPERLALMTDREEMPYEHTGRFVYEPSWTADTADAIRIAVQVMCMDTHDELKAAWRALAAQKFPPLATAAFEDMRVLDYQNATQLTKDLRSGDKLKQVSLQRQLGQSFRRQYEQAMAMAGRGQ